MTPILLILIAFGSWWLIGLGLFAALGAETSSLRIALTAPALGTCVTGLVLFVFSDAGVAIANCAVPIVMTLLVAAVVAIGARRPRVAVSVVPVVIVVLIGLLLVSGPMRTFGFAWIANANDDMGNYVLSATNLLHHGLTAHFDVSGLSQDRAYSTVLQGLHLAGARPGADITLAAVARLTGRFPYEAFMPLTVTLALCGASAVGALAMQATSRWWAAVLAAGLIAISPLATYGALQQLLPQVWGLGLAAALLALLMRPELHRAPGARARDVVPIAILVTTLVVVYIELASTLAGAYALYVVILALRREANLRAIARLWIPALVIVFAVINTYLLREVNFISQQASNSFGGSGGFAGYQGPPVFGYALVPAALPGVVGLERLPAGGGTLGLHLAIIVAGVLLIAALVAATVGARRGAGAATVLVVYALLAAVLASKSSDFGLYKLYMYAQPFLAAATAVLVSRANRPLTAVVAGAGIVLLVVLLLPVQQSYVNRSREPVDLPHASSDSLLPAFRRYFAAARDPVISVTENPALGKLEAVSVGRRPLYFVSANVFASLPGAYAASLAPVARAEAERAGRAATWQQRSFNLFDPGSVTVDPFGDNAIASAVLSSGKCLIVLPTGSEAVFNRLSLPEGSPGLVARPCSEASDLLAFTSSTLGAGFYSLAPRKYKTLYQLEPDYFYPGHTMSGVGRYLLFRVFRPTSQMRLELNFTETLRHTGSNGLPPAAVVGATRFPLPLVGDGSARVFSVPLSPQVIGGQPYLLVDLGRDGELTPNHRSGIEGLFASSIPLDPRYLTAYVRDISLVSASQYASLRPPAALRVFPADLESPNLEYSGLYEDGWMGERGYAVLAGGVGGDLMIRGEVPAGAGKHLDVLVGGRRVASVAVGPGHLEVRASVPASSTNRRVELRFAQTIRLAAPDLRPAAARLSFLGFLPRKAQ